MKLISTLSDYRRNEKKKEKNGICIYVYRGEIGIVRIYGFFVCWLPYTAVANVSVWSETESCGRASAKFVTPTGN